MTIKTIGIIGAGTMGNGIAQAFATKGFDVIMQDIADVAIFLASRASAYTTGAVVPCDGGSAEF